ncbi:MAG: Acetylornithine aminotransferase [Phycisphaerae bacterium]|nr:Acetylornithine aminotransferase [Phycisphaerae bacterium]
MNTQEIVQQFDRYVMANYGRKADTPVIVRGQGALMWDSDGREYLDMFPGWGVSSLGHCHPHVVEAIRRQAGDLIHIDNTFYSPQQGQLAQMLSERAFGGQCFFGNSGAEAVEGSIKLARLATPESRYKIITMLGSFHGRTFAAISATAQPKYQRGFGPIVPGFKYVPFADLAAVGEAIDDETAAVMLEPIQGEGGVNEAPADYLRGLRELCDSRGVLLIFDEVQTCLGRTGDWFGYQDSGVVPDIMTMAKAMGGGVAIGGFMAKPEIARFLVPGTHASTYGGNPLACAAAIATVEAIEQDNLLERTHVLADRTRALLEKLAERHPTIEEIRGRGLMIGVQLNRPGAPLVAECLRRNLRINCTHDTVIRFYPPMTATDEQVDQAVSIMDEAMNAIGFDDAGAGAAAQSGQVHQ